MYIPARMRTQIIVAMLVGGCLQTFDADASEAISIEQAELVMATSQGYAQEQDWAVAIAIVDSAGDLVSFRRADGVQLASTEIAISKARTSVRYRRPTAVFEEGIRSGNVGIMSLPGVLAYEGGLPLYIGTRLVGAIGVSGVTASQDGEVAAVGAATLEAL